MTSDRSSATTMEPLLLQHTEVANSRLSEGGRQQKMRRIAIDAPGAAQMARLGSMNHKLPGHFAVSRQPASRPHRNDRL
jgi:hypothetical protein